VSYYLGDIRDQVKALVQDDASFITPGETDIFINAAIRQLNHDMPYDIVKDIAGSGVQDYALPSEFEKGFSDISSVETPTGNNPPSFSDRDDDWFIYEDPTKPAGQQMRLRFKESAPSTGQTTRVIITASHVITLTSSTLNQDGFNAVCFLAAALTLSSLAARFNQSTDPTIAADTVDYGSRSQNYLYLAGEYRKQYKALTGKEAGEVTAGQALGEMDIIFSHGEDFLMHSARSR